MATKSGTGGRLSRRSLLGASAAGLVAACSPTGQPSGERTDVDDGGKAVELSLWKPTGQDPAAENKYYSELGKAFSEGHGGDRVKHLQLPWSDALTKFTAAFGGGTAPDVSYLVLLWLNQFASAGALTPLNEVDSEIEKSLAGVNSSALQAGRGKEGQIWGVPYYSSRWVLALNEDVWEKAGKPTPPTTYEELASFARRLTTDTKGRHPGDAGFDKGSIATYGMSWPGLYEIQTNYLWHHLWAYGADYVSEDSKSVGFDNDAGREILSQLRELQESGAATPLSLYSDELRWAELIWSGKAGLQWIAPPTPETFTKHPKARLRVLDVPKGPAGQFVVGGVGYLSVSAKSKHPQSALDFIKFATQEQNVNRYLQQTLLMPVRDVAGEDVYSTITDARTRAFLTAALPQGKHMRLTRVLPYNGEQYLAGEINNYLAGRKTLDAMIKDASKQIATMAKNAGL